MGYDVHITRAEHWSDNAGHEISSDEWLDVVKRDPQLKLEGVNGPFVAIWTAHPTNEEVWLDWVDGNITTKNPDEAILKKMMAIATGLNANVQDDDGEYYTGAESTSLEALTSRPSKIPRISLVLSLIAALGIVISIAFANPIQEQYPVGTSGRLPRLIPLALTGACSVICLILSAIAAASAIIEKLQPRLLAWIALAIDMTVILSLYVRSH